MYIIGPLSHAKYDPDRRRGGIAAHQTFFYKICQNSGGLAHLLPLDSKKQ